MKTSARFGWNVRTFFWRESIKYRCTVCPLKTGSRENCYSLFFCLSGVCELIPENITKKFQRMLAGFGKVCTFATAFERETHWRNEILMTECKPDVLPEALHRVSYLACCKGARKGKPGGGRASDRRWKIFLKNFPKNLVVTKIWLTFATVFNARFEGKFFEKL